MDAKPGCKTCGGKGRVEWIESYGGGFEDCPECVVMSKAIAARRAHLLSAFGPAVMWIVIYPHERWAINCNSVAFFIERPPENFAWLIEDEGYFLGIDGLGNLVELIDHEGVTFDLREWLNA